MANIEKGKLNITVLAGGIGHERDISIQSGKAIAAALKTANFGVKLANITPEKLEILDDTWVDIFFLALHGKFGEDGQLQKILEQKSLVYTGSGPLASEMAFDKMQGKNAFLNAGVNTPAAIEFNPADDKDKLVGQVEKLADKYVVKPLRQGSSFGVNIADTARQAIEIAEQVNDEFGDCMIEEFIEGRELTVGIVAGKALPIIEIRSKNSFYDFNAKYEDEKTEFLFDTIQNPDTVKKIKTAALDCFGVLGCDGFGRVDFLLTDDEIIYALEVNTIPGFTSHSLLPLAAAKAGISMSQLCTQVIDSAIKTKN